MPRRDVNERQPPDPNDPQRTEKKKRHRRKGLSQRMQRFAQLYFENGRNAAEAARGAGYAKSNATQQGYRLSKHPDVIAYIDDLLAEAREDAITSRDEIIAELSTTYRNAKKAGRDSAAVSALNAIAKIKGYIQNNNQQVHFREEHQMSRQEIQDEIDDVERRIAAKSRRSGDGEADSPPETTVH